ncbi:Histone H1 [Spatholobus suberectus]|nr:Histone H1 [Spatholobus suberectus]
MQNLVTTQRNRQALEKYALYLYGDSKPSTAMTTQNLQPRPRPNLPRDEDSRTTQTMSHLKDSLVSQLTKLHPSLSIHPHHTSLIQRRLQNLFPALHTPTHLPYALMIRNAIIELKEGPGSTEEAISEFIKREYNDLPWAHTKILSLQLEKLCEIGELARVEGGRYVLRVDDDEETEQCEGSQKRKRGKRRSDRGEESEEGQLQVFGEQSQQAEAEAQSQDSMLHLEATSSSQPAALKCIPAAEIALSPAQLQQQMPCNGPSESSLDAAAKMSGSLSSNVQECKQDENLMTGHPDHQCRERKPRKCKQIVDHQGESLLPSGDATVVEQESNVKKIDERCLSQPQGRGISGGRGPKLHRNAHRINKKIHLQDQAEDLVCSSHSNQKETSSSSQPAGPNSPVNPTHNSGQQLVVPTSEGSPECIISTGVKLPPSQLQQQTTSDIDLGTVSKRKASLTFENVHDEQLQHCNQGSPKGNLDENPISRDSEQKPPKRPRGRPPKLQTGVNYPGESLLPLDDDIHNEQRPNINKMEKQHQYGSGIGRARLGGGRGRGPVRLGRGRGRGRVRLGRPPKLNQNAKQCEEQLQQGEQDKQHGRGRGRGRPPKLNGNPIQYEEQSQQEDQAQQHGRGRGRGRPPKLIQNTNKCEAQLPQEVQAKWQHVRGRGRGRPPRLNQNTNQCEEQLQAQDQAQGLVNSPFLGRNDNQSSERKQLHVQSRGRHHKSESGEAKPPAGLRSGSEARCESGEVSQSNIEANQSHWRLEPIPCRVRGRDGCRSLEQNQK